MKSNSNMKHDDDQFIHKNNLFKDVADINTKNPEYILTFAIKNEVSKILREK